MTFSPYFPEYYLARISFREKRFDLAIQYFDRMEKAGLIRSGDPEYPHVDERTAGGPAGATTQVAGGADDVSFGGASSSGDTYVPAGRAFARTAT